MQNDTSKHKPIAVVGVSALFPGSQNANGFWGDILAGTDMVKEIPKSHWLIEDYYDQDQSARIKPTAAVVLLDDVSFNPLEFGVPPSIVPATDTAQLLALIVAQQVLQDATGGQFATMDKERERDFWVLHLPKNFWAIWSAACKSLFGKVASRSRCAGEQSG